MLHLYVGSKRYSSWSLRPYLALAHSGLPFECTTILLDRDSTKAETELGWTSRPVREGIAETVRLEMARG